MATFLIINTGGTIGMVASPDGLTPKAGVISDTMQTHPALASWQAHELIWQHWSPLLDSSDLQPEHWYQLRRTISEQTAVDGVLIIHGTDTLSYSAAALSYLLSDCPIPVVLTGSMRPILDPQTDAIGNLNLSLEALTTKTAEVYVGVGTRVLPASLTTKRSTLTHDAFDAPAWPGDWTPPETDPITFRKDWQNPEVAVFTLFPGFNPLFIEQAVQSGAKSILINAFGNGNAANTDAMRDALQKASTANIPIFVRSQCYEGMVNIGQYAASGVFNTIGAISCGLMPFEAVLTKLLLLCNEMETPEQIVQGFQQAISREWESTHHSGSTHGLAQALLL